MFVDSMDCFLTYNLTCINNTFHHLNSSLVAYGDTLDSNILGGIDRHNNDLSPSNIDKSSSSILVSVQHCIFTALILGAIILSTITGNILVIAAVKLEKSLHSVAYYLFVSLAVADLMVASMVMPIAVLKEVTRSWVLGSIICDVWVMIDLLCCTASILHLVAIALDRYWAITNLDYATKRTSGRILILICIIWVTSILISSAHLFPVFRDERGRPHGQCHLIGNVPYTIISTVGAFYIPLIVMCIIYWKIFQAAKFRIRRKAFNSTQSASTPLVNSGTLRTVRSFPAYQQDSLTMSTPNRSKLKPKTTKPQLYSSSEFRAGVSSNDSPRMNNRMKDIDTDTQSNHSTKPMKKALYALLKKDKQTVVNVTETVPPLLVENRLKKNSDDDQHELQVMCSDQSLINSCMNKKNGNSASHTIVNPLNDAVGLTSNSINLTNETKDKLSAKSNVTDTLTTPTHLNKPATISRSPALALRKKIDIKRERKATKVLGVVMGCFILCWLPFFIEETICGIFHLIINEKIISVLTWLGYLNSLLNPVIYTIFAPDFRQAFGKILFGKYRKRRRRAKK